MLISRSYTPLHRSLIAATAGSVLALASGAQAQLDDGEPSDPGLFAAGVLNILGAGGDPLPIGNYGGTAIDSLLQVNIGLGGDLTGNNRVVNFAEVNLTDGGAISGFRTDFSDAEVNLIDGSLRGQEDFFASSTLNQSGGSIGTNLDVFGTANISGGTVGQFFSLRTGGTLNLSGTGDIDRDFTAETGTTVNVSGGSFGASTTFSAGSALTVTGGDFGTSAAIANTANVSGGTFGDFLDVEDGGILNFSDGSIGSSGEVLSGGVANISGGVIGSSFNVRDGGVATITNGEIGSSFRPNAGSEVTISGGQAVGFFANEGDTTISGGDFDNTSIFGFHNLSGSELNLIGTEFFLDGEAVGTSGIITDRDVTLTGTLLDGTAISFVLNSDTSLNALNDVFAADSTLAVTVIPEPTSLALLGLGGLLLARRRRA